MGALITVGRRVKEGVANGGAVAAVVDRVHDRKRAAHTKGEAEKEADAALLQGKLMMAVSVRQSLACAALGQR